MTIHFAVQGNKKGTDKDKRNIHDGKLCHLGNNVFIHCFVIDTDDINFSRTACRKYVAPGHFDQHVDTDYLDTARGGTRTGTDEHCQDQQHL